MPNVTLTLPDEVNPVAAYREFYRREHVVLATFVASLIDECHLRGALIEKDAFKDFFRLKSLHQKRGEWFLQDSAHLFGWGSVWGGIELRRINYEEASAGEILYITKLPDLSTIQSYNHQRANGLNPAQLVQIMNLSEAEHDALWSQRALPNIFQIKDWK